MTPHDNWLELAALDSLGELTAQEHLDLQAHLRECAECRAAAGEAADVTANWLPMASSARPLASSPVDEQSRREAFLSRARAEGLRFSAAATEPRRPWVLWLAGWNTAPVGAAAAIGAMVLVVGAGLASWPVRPPAVVTPAVDTGRRVAELDRENARLRSQLEAAQHQQASGLDQLAAAERDRLAATHRLEQLEQWLASARDQSARTRDELQRAKAEAGDASQRLAAELNQLDALRAQLEQVKAAHASDRVNLLARQSDVDELSRQLRLQTASVERARDLLAADRDIRDLMGARNLHIVDVHDTNAKGKTQKSFGRMFYTEGKSLVFYAYDLEPDRVKNASFQVWGQKAGTTDQAVSLGMLYSDDQKQSRWAMTFNDPKVLREIDSVFVTIEAPGGSTKPSSQRMMYAFLLNEPNHR